MIPATVQHLNTRPTPDTKEPAVTTHTSYFIQSRPAPSQPWQHQGPHALWVSRDEALEKLAARREMQPSWEHRLMERTTTVAEQPAVEGQA